MNDAEYEQLLNNALDTFATLTNEKLRVDVEIAKLQQFMYAIVNLLSDEARARFEAKWKPFVDGANMATASLTDAIRNILRANHPAWLTVSATRDQLVNTGFNFTSYVSNPLASVSTTLRRLHEAGEADSMQIEGVTAYRGKDATPKDTSHPVTKLRRMRTFGPPEKLPK